MSDTTSRRDLLKGFGLVAGAAGMAGAAGVAAREMTAPRPSGLPAVIQGVDWRIVHPAVPHGTLPPVGAVALPYGRLVDADGASIGMFDASALPTSGTGSNLHRLELRDGTISAVGPSTFDDATFAVIGGTGRYSGASGTYHLSQRPAPSGGTAQFTLDITIPEA